MIAENNGPKNKKIDKRVILALHTARTYREAGGAFPGVLVSGRFFAIAFRGYFQHSLRRACSRALLFPLCLVRQNML